MSQTDGGAISLLESKYASVVTLKGTGCEVIREVGADAVPSASSPGLRLATMLTVLGQMHR